jgi:hypothetical protein
VRELRREIDSITGQVNHYLQIVMEPENEAGSALAGKDTGKNRNEEDESRLISAVLQEIFP